MEPDLQPLLQSSGLITFSFNKIFTIELFIKWEFIQWLMHHLQEN